MALSAHHAWLLPIMPIGPIVSKSDPLTCNTADKFTVTWNKVLDRKMLEHDSGAVLEPLDQVIEARPHNNLADSQSPSLKL